jgi:hypothetical protein
MLSGKSERCAHMIIGVFEGEAPSPASEALALPKSAITISTLDVGR